MHGTPTVGYMHPHWYNRSKYPQRKSAHVDWLSVNQVVCGTFQWAFQWENGAVFVVYWDLIRAFQQLMAHELLHSSICCAV